MKFLKKTLKSRTSRNGLEKENLFKYFNSNKIFLVYHTSNSISSEKGDLILTLQQNSNKFKLKFLRNQFAANFFVKVNSIQNTNLFQGPTSIFSVKEISSCFPITQVMEQEVSANSKFLLLGLFFNDVFYNHLDIQKLRSLDPNFFNVFLNFLRIHSA
jgi:hypothetical protein